MIILIPTDELPASAILERRFSITAGMKFIIFNLFNVSLSLSKAVANQMKGLL